MEVIREILHPNLKARPHEPNRSDQFASHRRNLMAKDMFDTRANPRSAPIVSLLLSGQGRIAIPFPVNLGAQPCGFEVASISVDR